MTTKMTGGGWKDTEVVFEGKSFVFFHRDDRDHIFSAIQRTGNFYEIELLNVLRALVKPDDWVVDAGANIGNHAVYFAGVCGCRVMAFEPNPVASEILKKTVEANGLGDRIEIHEVALGSQIGSGDVVMPAQFNLGMATVQVAEGGEGAVRIDLLSNYVGSRTIRLLKIDAEGMDYDVLAGSEDIIARDGCAISIEAAKRESYLKIAALVERHGYISAGSYNYTPTHIFLNEKQDAPDAFKARMARQSSLSYIDYTSTRDTLHVIRRDTTTQIGRVFDAITNQAKGLPTVLANVQGAGAETIRSQLESGFSQVSRELAELGGKTEETGASVGRTLGGLLDGHGERASLQLNDLSASVGTQISDLADRSDKTRSDIDAIATSLRELDDKVEQRMSELETGYRQLSGALEQVDAKISTLVAKVLQPLQQFEERSLSRHEAEMASKKALSASLNGLKDYVEVLSQVGMMSAEINSLCDAAQAHERKLLQSDIRALTRQLTGEAQSGELLAPAALATPAGRMQQQQTANGLSPSDLDAQYAEGPIPSDEPIRHSELVSIIMPSYNNEAWLERAINSALSQRGVKIELLVVDDGSTDGSVALACKIAQTAPNMRVISLLRNFGCYYARNIGVMNAKGAYITIIDSDDIMSPDRIVRQLDALKSRPGAIGCRCRQRRWSSDFKRPLTDLKDGENSLLWSRDVIDSVGYYDTVRFGGDSEFRLRLQRTYGLESIVVIPDELYFLRTLNASLTTSAESRIFSLEEDQLKVEMSQARKAYADSFTVWQKANKPKSPTDLKRMRTSFPLFSRSFSLGAPAQNASPSLDQKRVGAMASFPPRRESLKITIESILPQLDELILYLNDYDDVPEFAVSPKIRVVRSHDAKGDLRDNGKFYDLPSGDGAYIITFDDDLIYPPDYVARMIHYIEMLGRSCVVGLHGIIFPTEDFVRLDQRTVFFYGSAHRGNFVDLLGTGTTAWHSSTLQVGLDDFGSTGICDLWFAAAAARKGVPLFSIPREKNWLRLYKRFDESLYQEALQNPDGYFELYESVVAPALQNNKVRRRMEAHLARAFDKETLSAAGIDLREASAETVTKFLPVRRSFVQKKSLSQPSADDARQPLHFHVVVNGWNCSSYVDDCLRSIANQMIGPYTHEVTLIDDGSDDGTFEKMAGTPILPGARLIRLDKNTGPAHARHVSIVDIQGPETIVVLVDLDDALEKHALKTVAQRYLENPRCLLTIGNWRDQHGRINPQPFYSAEEIDGQRIREVELFNATHLRTFRRKLYDAIRPDDLYGPDGRWLETCTDVALMYPLIDQCWSDEVEFISEPIYKYTRQHGTGTLARFGKPHKLERLAFLKSKPPKSRFNSR